MRKPKPWLPLAGAGLGTVAVYWLAFVRRWNLLILYRHPLIDLRRLAEDDPLARWWLLGGVLLLGLLYWLGWRAARRAQGRAAWLVVAATALLSGASLLFLQPFDAADLFDNILHGRIGGVYGANPFVQVAADFRDDPFYSYAAWRRFPSAYGPAWELTAAGAARLADHLVQRASGGTWLVAHVLAFKLLVGLFLAGSVGLTALFLRRHAPERALAGTLLLAWNPLALYETLGHGHNDAALLFWILASVGCVATRRHTLAILSLVAGALFKFVPVLLLPAATLLAWRSLAGGKARLRFVIVTAAGAALLILVAYAPFWQGIEVLGVERRRELYTSSLPSTLYALLATPLGKERAASIVSLAAAIAMGLFALWQAMRLAFPGRERDAAAPPWQRYARASFVTLMFYLLAACPWFQQWYAIWPLGLAVLLPPGPPTWLGVAYTFAVFGKPLILEPIWVWPHSPPDRIWLELRLGPSVLAVSWFLALAAFGYGRLRERQVRG